MLNFSKFPAIENIRQELDAVGIMTLEGVVPQEFLTAARSYLDREIEQVGSTFSFVGLDVLRPTVFGALANDEQFQKVVADITRDKYGDEAAKNLKCHQVLRVLNGDDVNTQAYKYHFDNFTWTILVPVIIPSQTDAPNGDLFIKPNMRGNSSGAFKNMLYKYVMQNPVTRKFFSLAAVRKLFGFQKVLLKPGNAYIFYGFASYHGNGECANNAVRSTMLYHFHDPIAAIGLAKRLVSTKQRSRRVPMAS